jgi:hypothetical protein
MKKHGPPFLCLPVIVGQTVSLPNARTSEIRLHVAPWLVAFSPFLYGRQIIFDQ